MNIDLNTEMFIAVCCANCTKGQKGECKEALSSSSLRKCDFYGKWCSLSADKKSALYISALADEIILLGEILE